ncbi:MAG TPA: hypothetical protein VMW49_04235 [Candidatus Dormibacteraeota bacterium]|nr:hypothetical protein [Candidatus Dormibacteraeota bacterium]
MSRTDRIGVSSRVRLLLWSAAALMAVPLAASALPVQAGSTTCSSAAGKCVLVDVTPPSLPGGASAAFTVTLTNEASTQQLGSADITAPAGFPVQAVTVPPGVSVDVVGNLIELRNLGLSPAQTLTLTVDTTTSPCVAGTYTWTVQAKQSNDFQGPPGNAFAVDPGSELTTTVTGTGCHLTFLAQPADAQVTLGISSVAGDPTAAPVAVAVEDSQGQVVPVPPLTIGLSITTGTGPSGATLGGAVTATTSGGIASFAYPTISQSWLGYQLTAQSSGIQPGVSAAFNIDDVLTACAPGARCSGTDSNAATEPTGKVTSTTVSASSGNGSSADLLGISVGVPNISCAGYTAVSATAMSDVTGSDRTSTISLEIGKALVNQSPNNGASFYQVCFGSSVTFVDRSGQSISPGGTGLLPDCSGSTPAPCVVSRTKTKAGQVVLTFVAPAGDPFYRG